MHANRFKKDVPRRVSRGAPEFCTVYVIGKGNTRSVRPATAPLPSPTPPRSPVLFQSIHIANQTILDEAAPQQINQKIFLSCSSEIEKSVSSLAAEKPQSRRSCESDDGQGLKTPSMDRSLYDYVDLGNSTPSCISMLDGRTFASSSTMADESYFMSPNSKEDLQAEIVRLKLELKQTMEMYSRACREAVTQKQKTKELTLWKLEEVKRLEKVQLAEEAALAIAKKEKAKRKAALEAAEAAQILAELEGQKRKNAEMKALQEAEEKKKILHLQASKQTDNRCRRYTTEEIKVATDNFSDAQKIGQGAYGSVFMGHLDHTQVAIKVLHTETTRGHSQFQQEVEVLTRVQHPNMVLLLGACPEYGCLVYEYTANGSLEHRLFCIGNTPPLPWQLRFRIAADIGTGLLFLHQAKPKRIVHRNLKPANLLLDSNFVSKIGDVGLARLVPPSIANSVTQYHTASTAGTFCYIDPEYQQTGILRTKSDVYSLGIVLLQLITAKPPIGLTYQVHSAIEKGNFAEILDPSVPDWPLEETLRFAKLGLQCAEMRHKDRPDLGKVVLPELNRLRELAEQDTPSIIQR
ncbi:Serine-threonine/tyrosine-protein kinase, catalytic domain [Dillenia turbinata]|uniref:RING-type E3 ubiquitin transferase n=1 Tax=Dillenia turbinata TaxID=194707 RepID=A0AAN8W459_9MAGN